jgi:RND family efflux transporter MFP subunit
MSLSIRLRVLLASTLSLVASACADHPDLRAPEELPAATVRVATVAPGARTASEEVVGTVQARLSATVEAKISARVDRFPAVIGQRVRAGGLLVELDSREIRARLAQALAVRDQAKSDFERFEALLAREAVTRAEYDAALARQRVAEAALAEAETMLAHTRVVAPFDGVVVRKHADVGDLAAPGRPLIRLEDPTNLRLEVDVPEALVDRIRVGATLRVRIDTAVSDLAGTVAEIAPTADPASRTFRAKVDLPAESGLRAGQFGRVSIPVAEVAALRVPASAVLRRGQLEIAFAVEDGRARLRLVKTGKRTGDEVEVLSGVDAGETIVVEGVHALSDGQRVHVEP